MSFALIDAKKGPMFRLPPRARCWASARADIMPGKAGQRACVSAMTWFSWRTFEPSSQLRMKPTAVRVCLWNFAKTAWR